MSYLMTLLKAVTGMFKYGDNVDAVSDRQYIKCSNDARLHTISTCVYKCYQV